MGSSSSWRAVEGAHVELKFVEYLYRLRDDIIALVRRWTKNKGKNASLDAGETTVRILRTMSPPTVSVAGRVTVDSSPRLRSVLQQLIRRGIGPVLVIDFSEVSYLDTSGIATLLEASKIACEYSAQLRLIGVGGQPRMLAEVTALQAIFRACGSEVECR